MSRDKFITESQEIIFEDYGSRDNKSLADLMIAEGFNITPQTIYHYTTLEGITKIIESSSLFFNSAKEFNDPFELMVDLVDNTLPSVIIHRLDQLWSSIMVNNDISSAQLLEDHENVGDKIIKDRIDNIGIFCGSLSYKNISLWSHYASKHTGFCIELTFTEATIINEVMYCMIKYCDNPSRLPFFGVGNSRAELALMNLLFTKSTDWEKEQECRLVNLDNTGVIPIQKNLITGIHYGLNCSVKQKNTIQQLLQENNYNVQQYEMQTTKNSYKLIRREMR